MTINEMRQARAKLISDARALHELADTEKRELSAEENEQFDRLMNQADEKRESIERKERLQDLEREMGESAGRRDAHDGDEGGNERAELPTFQSRGLVALGNDWAEQREWGRLVGTTTPEYRAAFSAWVKDGVQALMSQRALQQDVLASGGYMLTPMELVDTILKNVDDMVYMRQWATMFTMPDADTLGVPTLASDPSDAIWTTELATGDEDTDMAFGRRELRPNPLAKRIKISNTLLRKVPSTEALVRDRLAYKFSVPMENAYLTGSGTGEPLGVFTVDANGINTDRDVATDNTATAVTSDGLIEAKYTLKPQYWGNAKWMMHRDGQKMIAKLKDTDGQYLWRESVRAGEPDRLLGLPVFMSEFAPNTYVADAYFGILGDFSKYWIVDSLAMQFQRLVELYAEANQTGLIGRLESDGQPVLPEAFVRVQLASA